MPLNANYLVKYTLTDLTTMAANYRNAIRQAEEMIDGFERDLTEIDQAVAAKRINPNAPITAEQRRALFVTFTDVFGASEQAQRLAFTRMVLGADAGDRVSWSSNKPGALTVSEASRVLDALDALNV